MRDSTRSLSPRQDPLLSLSLLLVVVLSICNFATCTTHNRTVTEIRSPTPPKITNMGHVLRNSTILFMGDSLTRYQFLHLVYHVEHGHNVNAPSFLCYGPNTESWNVFYAKSTHLFRDSMLCDCFRQSCCGGLSSFENRLYHSTKYNLTVWFVQWFGEGSPPHGHIKPWLYKTIKEAPHDKCMPANCSSIDNVWQLPPGEFFTEFVNGLAPDHVIFNSGHHTNYSKVPNSATISGMKAAISALKAKGKKTQFIWKSSTPSVKHEGSKTLLIELPDPVAIDWSKNGDILYFDVDPIVRRIWHSFKDPKKAEASMFWDRSHMHCWVYRFVNEHMVRLMKKIVA
eukprot:TRINITY_DN4553_c0_g1_i1.p1 TRINITY_DN4553_c0_g1~~TRINITY_DN4553_c0_g1_i1.p1  ORF type:complete len:341 (-),score=74.51 TRINITY_DN4553_c0_g1_i1:508-1530(-)